MFFTIVRTHPVHLHPSLFGPELRTYIFRCLYEEVEGTCDGYCFTICVMDVVDISKGRIRSGVGKAEFIVTYKALVWKPFVGEVVLGAVKKISSLGIFVEAGPMVVFVSVHLIPSDIRCDRDVVPEQGFTDGTQRSVIEVGSEVRMRLCGIRGDSNMIYAIGTLNQDYLGY